MSNVPVIALDAMGGDHGPEVVVPAALDVLRRHSELRLVLVGDEATLRRELASAGFSDETRCSIMHASEQVEMHESPSKALRGKKDSSMRVAINLVRDGIAGACVSAGNTGALMAIAKFVLKTIPGIDRPAIIASVPSMNGFTHVLDLGANVDCTAEHLRQFAIMGYELVKAVEDIPDPTVGLLNIGEEEIKGNEQVKQAARLIAESHINFVGFVEGNDIFTGNVDIVVTDGFVGNVALKTCEGVAKMISQGLKETFKKSLFSKVAGLIALPALRVFGKRFDPRQYNGASLLGLRGIVVKSHGNADRIAFARAIEVAMKEIKKAVPDRIGERVAEIIAANGGEFA
ncbi:phosphate acyltransferase PlsX [Candidatus Methylospira mobilis]|uniref:Phosphate acyltransferase n=1 Tax=Candidatus Methylospira mobilis TaxID=1808979 RepID=A0A5Q0BPF6_9GAMM|nr:phosphate acyltransferase PlsX [Candidatus Methylospira mobilis]QFY43616.1 phosphate acyltransferase PlsX [Candidatus Methylospira mobilis]WNV04606.1 phosphate acyltransferase PlsX [Candidatus Methylospira mobilis]